MPCTSVGLDISDTERRLSLDTEEEEDTRDTLCARPRGVSMSGFGDSASSCLGEVAVAGVVGVFSSMSRLMSSFESVCTLSKSFFANAAEISLLI